MGGNGRGSQDGFTKCLKCQYRWTWKTKKSCCNCGHCLAPFSSPPWAAEGVWADGAADGAGGGRGGRAASRPPWHEAKGRGGGKGSQPVKVAREETLLETLQRRKEELPESATTALAGLEAALQPAPSAPKPELPDEAVQRAWGAARRATKALNEAMGATEQAREWLRQCQEREDELAAEYGAALEEQTRAITHAKGCLERRDQAPTAPVSVNLSCVLEGREGLCFELGAAFDLEGITLSKQEQADWDATLERVKTDFS